MRRVRPLGPGTTFALAVAAAALISASHWILSLYTASDALAAVTWIVGWAVLCWTVIIGIGSGIALAGRVRSRLRVSPVEPVLLAAATALVIVVMWAYPLWGTGSAVG